MSKLILPRRKLLKAGLAGSLVIAAPYIAKAQFFNPPIFMPKVVSGFDPKSLVGTQGGFWRADMGVSLSGANVTGWADQSALGNNLAPLTGVPLTQTSPTFSATGFNTSYPGISFVDNSTKGLGSAAGILNSTTMTLLLLTIDNSTTNNDRIMGIYSTGDDFTTPNFNISYAAVSKFYFYSSANVGDSGSAGTAFSQSVPALLGGELDGAAANRVLNFAFAGSSTAFSSTVGGAARYLVLGNGVFAASMGATIAYCLLTNNVLAAGDYTNLKNWTNSNWGTSF